MTDPSTPEDLSPPKPQGLGHFITELRQRNVFKVAVAYVITGWLIIEAVTAIFPVFQFPTWTIQFVIVMVLLGFPIALIIAWAFEITPEGLKRTATGVPEAAYAPVAVKKLNTYITAALSVLVLLMLVERVYFVPDSASIPDEATTTEIADPAANEATATIAATTAIVDSTTNTNAISIMDKSIAVLPFDDFEAGGDEAYFADGLTEEILNALTRTPDLLVASRTSSFQYKDQAVDVQEVASALGVAHILEGSVRRSATRLRITVQLIRASDGFHLWSENYDRQPDDIIAVQEDIAFRIATALETAMDPEALRQMLQAGTRSVEAYNAYLKGLAVFQSGIGAMPTQAYEFFEAARLADPGFATAHFKAASFWQGKLIPIRGATAINSLKDVAAETLINYRERIDQAIATARVPDLHFYQADLAWVSLEFRTARDYLQRYRMEIPNGYVTETAGANSPLRLASVLGDRVFALELIAAMTASPVSADVRNYSLIVQVYREIGEYERGREFALAAMLKYPNDEALLFQTQQLLLWGGYYDEARELVGKITGTQLPPVNIAMVRLWQACADNNLAEANRVFETAVPNASSNWVALHTMNRREEAAELLRPLDRDDLLFSLSTYMGFEFFDVAEYPNLQRALEREQIVSPVYRPMPFACNR